MNLLECLDVPPRRSGIQGKIRFSFISGFGVQTGGGQKVGEFAFYLRSLVDIPWSFGIFQPEAR
jgi:hypothetical protein